MIRSDQVNLTKEGDIMRRLLVCIALTVCWTVPAAATCAFIKDHDQREMCKAANGGTCAFIKDRDQREYCKALHKGGTCAFIKNADLRNMCKAMTKKR